MDGLEGGYTRQPACLCRCQGQQSHTHLDSYQKGHSGEDVRGLPGHDMQGSPRVDKLRVTLLNEVVQSPHKQDGDGEGRPARRQLVKGGDSRQI